MFNRPNRPNFGSFGQKTLFEKFIIGFIAVVFILVVGGLILTVVDPKLAGELQAPAVEAQDTACTEGCRHSQNPEACYDGCMRNYNLHDDFSSSGRRRRGSF